MPKWQRGIERSVVIPASAVVISPVTERYLHRDHTGEMKRESILSKMRKSCKICHMPIEDWRNKGDVHPDCELKEDIQRRQNRNRFDGTGQDDEVEMEGLE